MLFHIFQLMISVNKPIFHTLPGNPQKILIYTEYISNLCHISVIRLS